MDPNHFFQVPFPFMPVQFPTNAGIHSTFMPFEAMPQQMQYTPAPGELVWAYTGKQYWPGQVAIFA
jgi:hypothetical protein